MASVTKTLPEGWQDKTIIGLAVLLAASPWLFGYADQYVAKWNAIVVAVVIAAGSASLLLWQPYWPGFISAFMAFWLSGSSRILEFTDRIAPTAIAAAIGIAVIVLALWSTVNRARAIYFAAQAKTINFEPPVKPPTTPTAPTQPKKAA